MNPGLISGFSNIKMSTDYFRKKKFNDFSALFTVELIPPVSSRNHEKRTKLIQNEKVTNYSNQFAIQFFLFAILFLHLFREVITYSNKYTIIITKDLQSVNNLLLASKGAKNAPSNKFQHDQKENNDHCRETSLLSPARQTKNQPSPRHRAHQ